MSNKSLLIALALGLESLGRVADQLVKEADAEDSKAVRDTLEAFVNNINDAKKDEAVEAVEAVPAEAAVTRPIDTILAMLNDQRYTLRSLSSLSEKSGLSEGDVIYELDDNDVEYVTKTKRRSNAKLIGLASRN